MSFVYSLVFEVVSCFRGLRPHSFSHMN